MSNDHEHDDDPGQEIAPASSGALTSLSALMTALNNVDMTSAGGRSSIPMLQFASREGGAWTYGQKRLTLDNSACWAANPTTLKWGFICFADNKVVGERLVPISQSKPDPNDLPDRAGGVWTEQWAVNLKCTSGADAGTEVTFKPTTVGGIQAITSLIEAVGDRLNGGQHDGKIAPIVRLEKDSYQHSQFGRVWTPMLSIVDWMNMDGPPPASATASAPASAPASKSEQPRRRRVV